MLYRFVRGFNEIYGVTMLFAFVAAFFVAFAFTLVFPIVPIVMIVLSPFLVVLARGGMIVLRAIEGALAREALRQSRCPACGAACDRVQLQPAEGVAGEVGRSGLVSECPDCRRVFTDRGEIYEITRAEAPVPPAQFEAMGAA